MTKISMLIIRVILWLSIFDSFTPIDTYFSVTMVRMAPSTKRADRPGLSFFSRIYDYQHTSINEGLRPFTSPSLYIEINYMIIY